MDRAEEGGAEAAVEPHNRDAVNAEIVRRTHVVSARMGRSGECYFGCDLSVDAFCKRVLRVTYHPNGVVAEVVTRG